MQAVASVDEALRDRACKRRRRALRDRRRRGLSRWRCRWRDATASDLGGYRGRRRRCVLPALRCRRLAGDVRASRMPPMRQHALRVRVRDYDALVGASPMRRDASRCRRPVARFDARARAHGGAPAAMHPRLMRRGHVAPGHLHQPQFVGVQLQRGELAAPDRAGVDGVHAVADEQAQRGPVAADDLQVALRPAGHFVPRDTGPAPACPGAPFSSNAMRPRGVQ